MLTISTFREIFFKKITSKLCSPHRKTTKSSKYKTYQMIQKQFDPGGNWIYDLQSGKFFFKN